MRLIGRRLAAVFGGLALAAAVAWPVAAQNAAPAAAPSVPASVVAAALGGTPDGAAVFAQYLGMGRLPPAEMTRRAAALIRALAAQGTNRPEELTGAVDRIAGYAARLLATASVIRFAIENDYRPSTDAIALDFGPADAPTMPGFEKVAPNDPRLAGKALAGLRRPLDQALAASGIAGVEKFTLTVPPGDYRLVLMTQNLGDPVLMETPFGREMRVNGVPVVVGRSQPPQWVDGAVLTGRGLSVTNGPGQTAGGFLSGELNAEAARLLAEQQGGALVVEVRAPDGRITAEMSGFGRAGSYITGLLVEPAGRLSDVVLRAAARDTLIPLDMRLALEAEILAAAASLLEQVASAAGDGPAVPDPEFEPADVVSDN